MRFSTIRRRGAKSFAAGVLIGLSIVTPVFAAATPPGEHWFGFVLMGALVLLIAGLMLEAAMHMNVPRTDHRKAANTTSYAKWERRPAGAASSHATLGRAGEQRLGVTLGDPADHVLRAEIVDTDSGS